MAHMVHICATHAPLEVASSAYAFLVSQEDYPEREWEYEPFHGGPGPGRYHPMKEEYPYLPRSSLIPAPSIRLLQSTCMSGSARMHPFAVEATCCHVYQDHISWRGLHDHEDLRGLLRVFFGWSCPSYQQPAHCCGLASHPPVSARTY